MSNLSLGAFISLKNEEKVSHYNDKVARALTGLSRWEVALKNAFKTKNIRVISTFSGLTPFYNLVANNLVKDAHLAPAAPVNETGNGADVSKADEFLKTVGISTKIANLFLGVSTNDLVKMSDEELLAMKGVGKKAVESIKSNFPKS